MKKKAAAVATCLCGDVTIEIAKRPTQVTQCNCSVCRRYGTLWAYYTRRGIAITAPRNGLAVYKRRARGLRFVRCARCGCITHWEIDAKPASRVGINARLLDAPLLSTLPIKIFDGDHTWRTLGHYVRPELFVSPHRPKEGVTPPRARARSR